MKTTKIKYFAYGSNMSEGQMAERKPNAIKIGIGQILDYQLVYDGNSVSRGGAVCNIVPKENASVWGVLYELKSFDTLDQREGYPKHYKRKEFSILLNDGQTIQATAYCRDPLPIGKPDVQYQDYVAEAAERNNLPQYYTNSRILGDPTPERDPADYHSIECPRCHRKHTLRIIYGDPVGDLNTRGLYLPGGVLPEQLYQWHCDVCWNEWGRNRGYD